MKGRSLVGSRRQTRVWESYPKTAVTLTVNRGIGELADMKQVLVRFEIVRR
jgi:hypothetical protein